MKQRSGAHVHHMVRDTAVAMAHEAYDALMQRNDWYALHKSEHPGASAAGLEKAWVNDHWAQYIEGARSVMASMLAGPIPDTLKDQIAEALILDKSLVRGRVTGQQMLN